MVKALYVSELKDILNELSDGAQVVPNSVGNLSVYGPNNEWLGYIDFTNLCFEKSE